MIKYGCQTIDQNDINAVLEVLNSEISVKTEGGTVLLKFSNIDKCKLDLEDQLKKKRI